MIKFLLLPLKNITVLILLVVPYLVKAQLSDENILSLNNRLKFGNHLFNERDYLRAMNEFREYLKKEDSDTIRFKLSESLYHIGRYKESAESFKGLFFNSSLSEEARLAFYKSNFMLNEFGKFRQLILHDNYQSEKYGREINRLGFISHLLDYSILPDSNNFFSAFEDSSKSDIRKFYLSKKYPEYKNPTTAALLSAILPGLGKIYTNNISDGITSLIATGLLTYLSINNFQNDHQFRGWLFAGLAAFSYAGNIYGSAASAQIYNAGIRFNFESEVKTYFEKRNYLLPPVLFSEK